MNDCLCGRAGPHRRSGTQPTFAGWVRRGRDSCVHGPQQQPRRPLDELTDTARRAAVWTLVVLGIGGLRNRRLAPPPRRGAPVPRLRDRSRDAPGSRSAARRRVPQGVSVAVHYLCDRRADRAVRLDRRSPCTRAGRRGARRLVAADIGRRSRPGGRQLDGRPARDSRRAAKAAAGAAVGVEPRPSRASSSA